MPLGIAAAFGGGGAATVGDGIAFEADRVAAAVADLVSLLLLECVVSFGGEKYEPVPVADVLHVGEASPFAIGSFSFADVDAVFGDQLSIEQTRILAGFDPASHIEPISVAQVADGHLLDQSFR